jgi:hypothetical protein
MHPFLTSLSVLLGWNRGSKHFVFSLQNFLNHESHVVLLFSLIYTVRDFVHRSIIIHVVDPDTDWIRIVALLLDPDPNKTG